MADEIGVLQAIYTARGLRRFKPDPIPDEILARIMEATTRAPNATNLQKWRFIVIKDAEVRKAVAGFYKKAAEQILPQVERIFLDETRYLVPMEKAKRQQLFDNTIDGFNHFDVPPVLVLACTYPEPPRWEGNEDVLSPFIIERMKAMLSRANASSIYHAVQNLTLAARNFGVATCMTNLHTLYEPEIKLLLGIPDEILTWALLSFGISAPRQIRSDQAQADNRGRIPGPLGKSLAAGTAELLQEVMDRVGANTFDRPHVNKVLQRRIFAAHQLHS